LEKPLGLSRMLEPQDEVIGVPGDDHIALCVPASPLVGP
jgi:hypothetical protein